MAKIVKGVKAKHPNIPITLFSKNGGKYLTYIADTLCDETITLSAPDKICWLR
jgi:uroporphyrinogen decarboxylase